MTSAYKSYIFRLHNGYQLEQSQMSIRLGGETCREMDVQCNTYNFIEELSKTAR